MGKLGQIACPSLMSLMWLLISVPCMTKFMYGIYSYHDMHIHDMFCTLCALLSMHLAVALLLKTIESYLLVWYSTNYIMAKKCKIIVIIALQN